MRKPEIFFLSLFIVLFGIGLPARSATGPQPQSGPFATPITDASLDVSHFAEWVGGHERPLANPGILQALVWTRTTMPASSGMLAYGASTDPGPRYLRLAFTQPVAVGSVLVRGGDQLSVLRPGAPYPGNLADDSQWIPAQHIANGQAGDADVSADSYAVWVLPSVMQTRAIRFSHISLPSDTTYSGEMGGAYVLATRFANLATEANVQTSANNSAAGELINDKYDGWPSWDNGPDYRHTVSPSQPEWIVLHWQKPVTLRGLAALWAGFNAADVEVFTGPADMALENAPESDWRVVGRYTLSSQYPLPLGVDWFDFGSDVTTRAVRLRMTAVTNESHHPHLVGKTRNGTRVWLGELMALSPLGASPLQTVLTESASQTLHPPIPIHFTLPAAGYVSLVIDDASGNRVRNLVSDTYFPAGQDTVWWDGSDDLERDNDAGAHGQYYIPAKFVAPGRYTVRGIEHQAINLNYEFSVYAPGTPPWDTADGTGGWLTSHTPAWSALFVPANKAPGGKPLVYLGCYLAEGGSGLAWVDLDGRKQGGEQWVGGTWTGAAFLARDSGPAANPQFIGYAASVYGQRVPGTNTQTANLRLTALSAHGDKPLQQYELSTGIPLSTQAADFDAMGMMIGGLAARDGVLAVSVPSLNQILFMDAASGRVLGKPQIDNPRGLTYDAQGNLLVLTGRQLVRFRMTARGGVSLTQPQVLVAAGLEDPHGIAVDDTGNIFVSDWGNSNQVKVFSPTGRMLRTIGHAGLSKAGPYDPLHMNDPLGIAIDSNQHLWVAEKSAQPKRVSVWTLDGQLVKAFYGGPEYGGGGSLDAVDKTKFYYDGMEFRLDWDKGTSTVSDIILLRDAMQTGPVPLPAWAGPTSVLESHGRQYFHDTFQGNNTVGVTIAVIYQMQDGVAHPVAAAGKANDWPLLQGEAFRSLWPGGADPSRNQPQDSVFFTWSDSNGNGKADPAEVTMEKGRTGWLTVMPDLSIVDAYLDGNAIRLAPGRFTPQGVPVYDLHSAQTIATGAQWPLSDGGGQALYSAEGTVLTTAPEPFPRTAVGGIDPQNHRWSYPNLWPGLHPSHNSSPPDRPGELIGVTHLLGEPIHPDQGAEPLWGVNGNEGDLYLFTMDGLYVTQLFQDVRTGQPWTMPRAVRNMSLNQVSLHDEDFFPSLTQTSDGKVYAGDGFRTALVRVDGLNTVQRLPNSSVQVTSQSLMQAQGFFKQQEAARQLQQGPKAMDVFMHGGPAPQLSEVPSLMKSAMWATIDHRTNTAGWSHEVNEAQAAVMIAGGRLYAVYRTGDANLLRNSGAVENAPFKSGGALDLMIGSNPNADPKRTTAVEGDERLLVYQVNGQTKAMLYRPVSPGARNPVSFSSPLRTITMDSVQDVSSQVQLLALNGSDAGTYVISIPLQELSLRPAPGENIRADLGLLRGDGTQTLQRVYWSNKATAIVSDVPSEAELTPSLWGTWTFKAAP